MNLSVRELSFEERRALWEWSQETIVTSSIKKAPTDYYDHCQWFSEKINSEDEYWFVGIDQALRFGIIRFIRLSDNHFDTKIMIKPYYCGKNYSKKFLTEAIIMLKRKCNVDKINYYSKYFNDSTKCMFMENKFTVNTTSHAIYCELSVS